MVTSQKNGSTQNNRISEVELKIQPLNLGRLKVNVRGLTPLVVQAFGSKTTTQLLEAQMREKGAKQKKIPRCPEEEFLSCFYIVDGEPPEPEIDKDTKQKTYDPKEVAKFLKNSTFGVPAVGFKNAMIAACRNTDYTMTNMRQSIAYVRGLGSHPDYCVIKSKNVPIMDSRVCRLPGAAKTPMVRFRPMWIDWETSMEIEYDANNMTASEVVNLLAIAGAFVGICEGRPQNCALGWGRWEVV